MNVLKGLACAGVVGAGVLFGAPQSADAGGFSISIGRGGYGGYGGYGGFNRGFVGRSYGYNTGYSPSYYGGGYGGYGGYGGQGIWHDTSHYDYHPGGLVPHGNHYHYIPGHYDYHQTGHWH